MGFYFNLILVAWTIWAYMVVKFLRKIIYTDCKFSEKLDPSILEEHKPFQRFDRHKWNVLEIYLVGIFLLPFRISLLVGSIFQLWTLATILGIKNEKQSDKEFSIWKRELIKLSTRIVAKMILFSTGIYSVPVIRKKIKDYDPSYPFEKYANKNQQNTPILISNHQSWLDVMVMSQTEYVPSFLSKKEVSNYPLFGRSAHLLQSLFVERESESTRNQVSQLIENRGKVKCQGKNYPPIHIFPEGTTTNGSYLISFKKGAFEAGFPVKIFCIKYIPRNYHPAVDSIPILAGFLLAACQLQNKVELTEFDTYYPDHLPTEGGKCQWEIYAQKVKNIMLNVLNCQDSKSGYRDMKQYEQVILKQYKRKLSEEQQK